MEIEYQREQFAFYKSFLENAEELPEEEQGKFLLAVVKYALRGDKPELHDPATRMAFALIKPTLDSSRRKSKGNLKESSRKPQRILEETSKNPRGSNAAEGNAEQRKKNEIVEIEQIVIPFAGILAETFNDWLKYKKEKKDAYEPTGMKNLISRIQKYVSKYGEAAVIELIKDSMASGYKGIVFDKLEKQSYQQRGGDTRNASSGYQSNTAGNNGKVKKWNLKGTPLG